MYKYYENLNSNNIILNDAQKLFNFINEAHNLIQIISQKSVIEFESTKEYTQKVDLHKIK